MLEAKARCGHGRILAISDEHQATTPALIHVDVGAPIPDWAEIVLTESPTGQRMELVSGGTWFHPSDAEGLLVPAPQPTATHQVQVLHLEDIAIFHDAGGWANDPKRLVPAFIEAKSQADSKAFWAPALGTPADYALWAYLGVDLFDASPLLLAAVRGVALTTDGPVPAADMEARLGGTWDTERLTAFNLDAAREELSIVRQAIEQGTLRQLAERRIYSHPSSVAVLRRFDAEHNFLESAAPARDTRPVPCMTWESLWMPEVERFRRRVRDQYTPPASADVLVLLPCSARKPYRISQSHRYFARALDDSGLRHRCHEVMVTSPLGIVPRELEDSYPANRYDVPVTGNWNEDEKAIMRQQLQALLAKHDYQHVVAHVPPGTFAILGDILPEGTLHTGHGNSVQSKADCDRLREALIELKKQHPKPSDHTVWAARKREDVQGMASFQLGEAAAAELMDGAKAQGKVPHVKIHHDGKQLGMSTMDRGMLSLTLEGGEIVAKHAKRVYIEDFYPKKTGSLFAVGVTHADPDVRTGDDVVIMHGNEMRAVGVAQMPASEMAHMRRGVAVTLRHVHKQVPVPLEVTHGTS